MEITYHGLTFKMPDYCSTSTSIDGTFKVQFNFFEYGKYIVNGDFNFIWQPDRSVNISITEV
jgi:hypothetical protein